MAPKPKSADFERPASFDVKMYAQRSPWTFSCEPPEEVQQQILDAYQAYLQAPEPPEHGLHYSIAGQIAKVSPRQVHKVLQNYRHRRRAEYPLI